MSALVELELESYTAQRLPPLAPEATYEPQTALATAWLSQLAYESDAAKIDAVLHAWGLERAATIGGPGQQPQKLTATRGLVVHAPSAVILAFAGTDPLSARDWLTDLRAWPSPDDLHAGFAAAVDAVWAFVADLVREADAAGEKLIVTGHSLGAALACIAAKRIHDEGLAEVAGVYAFGMPRCGGERFARDYGALAQRTWRLVHGHDIVPTIPLAGVSIPLPGGGEFKVGIPFRHVGCLVASGAGKSFAASRPEAEPSNAPFLVPTGLDGMASAIATARSSGLPPQLQPGWRGRFYRTLPIWLYDHLPAAYLTALGATLISEGV